MYIELKPCPFCGEKNNIDCVDCGITTGTIKGFVKCQNCGAAICSTHGYIDAIKLWNRWEKVVQKQPTADVVEVRHGKWKLKQYEGGILDGEIYDECSICEYQRFFDDIRFKTAFNYCPNCGAKMDGKE